MYIKLLKRPFDFCVSFFLLLLGSPLLICTSVLLSITNSGRPFFFQLRPGKDEKIFKIIKFKTMTDRKDSNGVLLSDDQRLTIIGKWIRKLSIDELPQMLNVLKGEMSIIGPRPLLVEYLPLYSNEQRQRHNVRPGITGWAQVNGRNTVNWKKRFEMDIWYVNHRSFLLDFKILLLTIKMVIVTEGISGEGTLTMDKFKGNV